MPITFAESAVQDLEDILSYYADQAMPQVGSRLVAEAIADIELLSSQPRLGRMVPEFEQDFLLELIRPPFRIVYRVDREQIRIVRVWRSERLLKLP
ncbi:MAG: addiction module toxin RelE [Desulfobulbaceae bacterium A2]|nr:MAG: addiction module toxin RelE [Desulfobulbaceae bacterium A2]